jgi:hypothetical protein
MTSTSTVRWWDEAVTRRRSIDRLHADGHRAVHADGEVGADEVVVDGGRDAHDGEAELVQRRGAALAAVAADDDEAVDAAGLEVQQRLVLHLARLELGAARAAEDGARALDDAADVAQAEGDDVVGDEARVAALDAEGLDAAVDRGAGDGADGRVHAGGVTAAREDSDLLHRHRLRLRVSFKISRTDTGMRPSRNA